MSPKVYYTKLILKAPELANTTVSSSKQATQLSCCRRLLAAKVRWTVCLSLTRLLCLLCAGDAENAKQPTFSVEPIISPDSAGHSRKGEIGKKEKVAQNFY